MPAVPVVPPLKPVPDSTHKNAGRSAQPTDFAVSESSNERDLLTFLKPGDVLTGRVVDQFANGAYLFTIRGRNVIAESQLTLLRDSVVQFEVINTKDGLHIQLTGAQHGDSASTSDMNSRLLALRIPVTATSLLVMQAFEHSEAPLDTSRLQRAIQSVQAAPSSQHAVLAASHALLARHDLPVTPAFLNLANRAVSHSSQHHHTALNSIQALLGSAATATSATASATASATPATPSTTATPAGVLPLGNNSSTGTPPTPTSNNTIIYHNTEQTTATRTIPRPDLQSVQTLAQHVLRDMPNMRLDHVSDVRSMLSHNGIHALIEQTDSAASTTTAAFTTATFTTATLTTSETATAAGTSNSLPASDPALLNNVLSLRSVMQELAHISQHLHTHPHPQGAEMLESMNAIIQDMSAESFFKPQHLKDYDYVLPLFSQHHGETQQARIAIASRTLPGQQDPVTFLRVDMELSHLGPLSLRMSSGNGPVAITIFATTPIVRQLALALPQLEEDLHEQRIDASIRIADLLDHVDAHSAS